MRAGLLRVLGWMLIPCCTSSTPSSTSVDQKPPLVASDTCRNIGELECPGAPFQDLEAGACAHLTACLEGRVFEAAEIMRVTGCETAERLNSSVPGLASISVDLDTDGPPSHANYLLLQTEAGWCAVAEILAPTWTHGGHCEAQISLLSQSEGEASTLNLLAERTCHMPLDQEEIESGEDDVAAHECWEFSFGSVPSETPRVRRSAAVETSMEDGNAPCRPNPKT